MFPLYHMLTAILVGKSLCVCVHMHVCVCTCVCEVWHGAVFHTLEHLPLVCSACPGGDEDAMSSVSHML